MCKIEVDGLLQKGNISRSADSDYTCTCTMHILNTTPLCSSSQDSELLNHTPQSMLVIGCKQ